MAKTLTNGNLTIEYNKGFFERDYYQYSNQIDDEITDKKKAQTFHQELEQLKQLGKDIVNGKYGDIFSYLPLTKKGKFSKTGSIVLATSKIKFWDGYASHTVCLTIQPMVEYQKAFSYAVDDSNAYLAIEGMTGTRRTPPVFDENLIPRNPNTVVKHTYLSNTELIPGHMYEDEKGKQYIYLGNLLVDSFVTDKPLTKKEFAESEYPIRSQINFHYGEMLLQKKVKSQIAFIVKKKHNGMLKTAKTISDIFQYMAETNDWSKKVLVKNIFVKDCGQVVDDTVNSFYNGENKGGYQVCYTVQPYVEAQNLKFLARNGLEVGHIYTDFIGNKYLYFGECIWFYNDSSDDYDEKAYYKSDFFNQQKAYFNNPINRRVYAIKIPTYLESDILNCKTFTDVLNLLFDLNLMYCFVWEKAFVPFKFFVKDTLHYIDPTISKNFYKVNHPSFSYTDYFYIEEYVGQTTLAH